MASLMYKVKTKAKDSADLSLGSDRSCDRRKQELPNNKIIKGKYHLRIKLKDVFGFAESQEKATHGFGYKLTVTRNKDDAVLQKTVALADCRIETDHILWYVPHYTPSIQQRGILSEQILSKTPTELK